MEKHVTLIMVAAVAFQGAFDVASPAAGFVQQSVAFGVPVKSMLDGTGVNSIMLGVGSFIWVPLAHTYGRRPVFLFSGLVATLGALGCALSKNNGAFIGSRVSNFKLPLPELPFVDARYRTGCKWIGLFSWSSFGWTSCQGPILCSR